ncbi:MAG: segregation/condensation protein A [Clostridia bacterium]|nr:segregation/condensation protein A [Clostridia bacterium]
MTFQCKDFDGPLELLLELIHKAKIDIHDIFVSDITEQYIAYVRSMTFLDMDDATEFLVMASTLLEIKSRAMLPKPPKTDEAEEDPEEALIRRLEEYKQFKETASAMKAFESAASSLFAKLPDEFPLPPQETVLVGLTLEGLTEAFQRILLRKPAEAEKPETNHYAARSIHRDSHTVQECMLTLLKGIRKKPRMRFEEAFSEAPTREEVVTLFLAMLELLRMGEMHVLQDSVCGEIYLLRGRGEAVISEEEESFGKHARTRNRQREYGGQPEGTD